MSVSAKIHDKKLNKCFDFLTNNAKEHADPEYRKKYHDPSFHTTAMGHRSCVGYAVTSFIAGLVNGATEEEVKRYATFLMVSIDAKKHQLNYRQCKSDMGIVELRQKYGSGTWDELYENAVSKLEADQNDA